MQDWMIPESAGEAPHEQWRLDPKRSGATSTVGDIGTHAAHLAGFVSGLAMTSVRADFHVCGHPKTLEDTAFMMTRFAGSVPGSLLATRLAPGNRGGLRLRIFGSEGGVEWDMEHAERLKLARFGHPDQIFTRGQGHGIAPSVERLTRTGRGFPEGLLEAWANLYTEFAMAVALKQDGLERPEGWLALPEVRDGAAGVAFVDAAVRSNASGQWADISRV
jgi:predicted dehydrogenase